MIRKIDDFIIDRFFQPMSDILSDMGSSCYKVGQQLAIGAAVFSIIICVLRTQEHNPPPFITFFSIFLVLIGSGFLYLRHTYYENKKDNGTIPIERETFLYSRIFMLFIIFFHLVSNNNSSFSYKMVTVISDILIITTLYFLACVRNPPKQTFNKMAHNSV